MKAAQNMTVSSLTLRPATPEDRDSIIRLIDTVYREYGDRICLDRVDCDLLQLDQHYGPGCFMVLEHPEGGVRGTVAIVPDTDRPEVCWLKRLYLDAGLRGTGWGLRLLEWACDAARAWGARRMEFWSDTRFTRAHAFYEKHGFIRNGVVRTLDDGWAPYSEYFFYREL